jgi:hypothetical protein
MSGTTTQRLEGRVTTIYLATAHGLGIVRSRDEGWEGTVKLEGKHLTSVAADPFQPGRLYCGSFGQGLWRSDDAGESWEPVGTGIAHDEVMAVTVSPTENGNGFGVVWAGTEPSELFRSEDGGATWEERPALKALPSAPTWSFPPRPWTHHVRWIQPDPLIAGHIYVGIELGGVMRSLDGGATWEDRKAGAQSDAHTLQCHRLAPGRIYEAAGGGYAESFDRGASWRPFDEGLPWHYLWGLAVDPADPNTIVASVSPGPRHAHTPGDGMPRREASGGRMASGSTSREGNQHPPSGPGFTGVPGGYRGQGGPPPWATYDYQGPEAAIYRRRGEGAWEEVRAGLPNPRGTLAYAFATNEAEPHAFYAAPHGGDLYRSSDAGGSWSRLDVTWPDAFLPNDLNNLIATEM